MGLAARRFYALTWKDLLVRKRHPVWTLLEATIPVLVCALAILSSQHQGKPRLEDEKTFDQEDFERIYGELQPHRHTLLLAPNSSFTRALVAQVDEGALTVRLCPSEAHLVELIEREIPVKLDQLKQLIPDATRNVTVGGVVLHSDFDLSPGPPQAFLQVNSKLDGAPTRIPLHLNMSIRAKDFRLGPEPFPKKFSLGPFIHADHYLATFFAAAQLMLSRAYLNLLAAHSAELGLASPLGQPLPPVPGNEDILAQRMPYPKYVAHKRLRESTLGTFVAGSQKQKPFVLTMDYCITVGFLVTAIFLAKRIVDEKKSRVRDMLRLVGISDWTYYASHASNTMLMMILQLALITLLFTGHSEAPARNIHSGLMLALLVLYCLSALLFVQLLSTLFSSSTKAIVCTSLLWLGLPEVVDRVFKLDAGVIESNGFVALDEHWHLAFCLMPNFALRLANRLLTECDIYGEFYNKKQLYGQYRAIWPNIFEVLPLYKTISLGYIMLALAFSVPLYAALIYLSNHLLSSAAGQTSLASLGGAGEDHKSGLSSSPLAKLVIQLLVTPLVAPFKVLRHLLRRSSSKLDSSHFRQQNLSMGASPVAHGGGGERTIKGGHINSGFSNSLPSQLNQSVNKIEMNQLATTNVDLDQDKYFEPAARMLQVGVSIRNVCKTYRARSGATGDIHAVRGVSLDMYYSQILVLLGHNGAGKTTLIDIISGHNHKTSGTVLINGHSIDTSPSEARSQLGFCPQFDVLFQRLTVEEHLYFYGLVKGAHGRLLRQEIEQLLSQSGLDKHRAKLSKALSGGYKRKLSLAIAMVAGSRVLILDEPTSGMDPESRRKVWDFLQLIRHERLIMLTTHHMEEADALGDRVAVMAGGQVKCAGSALFLKRLFNAGYHLRISKAAHVWSRQAFDKLVGERFRLADHLENETPHELMYAFDADQTEQVLPALFDQLEKVREQVGIFGFGVTVATMDDVFMKIGLHFDESPELGFGELETSRDEQVDDVRIGSPKLNQQQQPQQHFPRPTLEGNELLRQQVRALLAKRYQHAQANWFQLVWMLGVSLACIVSIVALIELVVLKEEVTPEWSREMSLAGAGYGQATEAIYQFAPAAKSSEEAEAEVEALRAAAFPGSTPSSVVTTNPPTIMSPTTSTTTAKATSDRRRRRTRLAPTTVTDGQEQQQQQQQQQQNESATFFQNYWLPQVQREGVAEVLTYTDANTQMIDLLTRQFANFRERYIIGGERTSANRYIAWYNGEATHSLPISMNVMLNSILRQQTDLMTRKVEATRSLNKSTIDTLNSTPNTTTHPLRGSRITLRHIAMAQINTLIIFLPQLGRLINLVFLPFSLAFITSYFVIFPTHERVSKCKHLQIMTGVSLRTYWLAHFLFDLALYGAYTTLMLLIYFIWDRVLNEHRIYFANFEHSVALIALVSLFILGALPLAYTFSFIAKKPTSAFSSFCVLTILTGTATLTLVSLYELKYEHSASVPFKVVFTGFLLLARLIPSVSLLVGLQKLFALNSTRAICINVSPEVLELFCRYRDSPIIDEELRVMRPDRCCKQVCADECFDQWPFFWTGWFGVNVELAFLVFDAALFWAILVLIESASLRQRLATLIRRLVPLPGGEPSLWSEWATKVLKPRTTKWQVPQGGIIKMNFNSSTNKQNKQDNTAVSPDAAAAAAAAGRCPAGAKSIEAEQQRVAQVVKDREWGHHSLVVSELAKTYRAKNFRAVDGLSFLVERREFFGLLGVNGAGKSSTFKMLTGQLEATSGRAWAGSSELATERTNYLRRIGYCPQQDALIASLTGLEMLELFARLRGLPEQVCRPAARQMLARLGLGKIGQQMCQNYSGGNKRRLSVAMALIGAPELVFLDEPTSGVDPRSRRKLWFTLIEFQRQTGSSVVMTSHSMNECECLCDRVAIMVGGQFRVMGSVQHLRTRLSRGFSLVLKLRADELNTSAELAKQSRLIQDYMEREFAPMGRLQLKELHQTIMQYHLEPIAAAAPSSAAPVQEGQQEAVSLAWSSVLVKLEEAKKKLQLEDYQITSDASLESIFLSLAKQQDEQPPGPRHLLSLPPVESGAALGYNERAIV